MELGPEVPGVPAAGAPPATAPLEGARTPGGAAVAAAGRAGESAGAEPSRAAAGTSTSRLAPGSACGGRAATGAGLLVITPGGGPPETPTYVAAAGRGRATAGADGAGTSAGAAATTSSGGCALLRPSRSALRRTLSAWASSMLEEWLVTPIPIDRHSSRPSLLVKPSSRASSYTRIFFDKLFFGPFLRLPRRPCPGHRLYLACSILACPEALANSAPTSAASTSWRKARLKARRLAALAIHSGRAMSGTPDRHSQAPRPGAPLSTTSRPSWLSATLSIVPASALARHPMQVRTGAAV